MKSAIAASRPLRSGHRNKRMALFFKVEPLFGGSFYFTLACCFVRAASTKMVRAWARSRRNSVLVIVLFDEGVAFAGERFEFLPIQNSDEAASVFDYAFS